MEHVVGDGFSLGVFSPFVVDDFRERLDLAKVYLWEYQQRYGFKLSLEALFKNTLDVDTLLGTMKSQEAQELADLTGGLMTLHAHKNLTKDRTSLEQGLRKIEEIIEFASLARIGVRYLVIHLGLAAPYLNLLTKWNDGHFPIALELDDQYAMKKYSDGYEGKLVRRWQRDRTRGLIADMAHEQSKWINEYYFEKKMDLVLSVIDGLHGSALSVGCSDHISMSGVNGHHPGMHSIIDFFSRTQIPLTLETPLNSLNVQELRNEFALLGR